MTSNISPKQGDIVVPVEISTAHGFVTAAVKTPTDRLVLATAPVKPYEDSEEVKAAFIQLALVLTKQALSDAGMNVDRVVAVAPGHESAHTH